MNEPAVKQHFKTIKINIKIKKTKTKLKVKHLTKKRLENEPGQKQRQQK